MWVIIVAVVIIFIISKLANELSKSPKESVNSGQ